MGKSYIMSELVNIDKAAEILGCGLRKARIYEKQGRLQRLTFGYHQVFYRRTDVFWLLHELTEEKRERVAKYLANHFRKEASC